VGKRLNRANTRSDWVGGPRDYFLPSQASGNLVRDRPQLSLLVDTCKSSVAFDHLLRVRLPHRVDSVVETDSVPREFADPSRDDQALIEFRRTAVTRTKIDDWQMNAPSHPVRVAHIASSHVFYAACLEIPEIGPMVHDPHEIGIDELDANDETSRIRLRGDAMHCKESLFHLAGNIKAKLRAAPCNCCAVARDVVVPRINRISRAPSTTEAPEHCDDRLPRCFWYWRAESKPLLPVPDCPRAPALTP
jgi:hypothetical protein